MAESSPHSKGETRDIISSPQSVPLPLGNDWVHRNVPTREGEFLEIAGPIAFARLSEAVEISPEGADIIEGRECEGEDAEERLVLIRRGRLLPGN